LEQLNFAELAFWEQNVVPVRVNQVKAPVWNGDTGEELVEVEQLLDDPDYPINAPIRRKEPPDFATILQEKKPPVGVELSPTRDLWDRRQQVERWVERTHVVRDIPERADAQVRSLWLIRPLRKGDRPTPVGMKAY